MSSSLQAHVDSQTNSQEAARTALLDAIVEETAAVRKHGNPITSSAALKDLAEAYAWITVPNNSH